MLTSLFFNLALVAPSLAQFVATTTFTFSGNALPTGLSASDWIVPRDPDTPAVYDHLFVPDNVRVQNGFLELLVPGGQTENPIRSAEVFTWFNILYGSIRTYAILTEEPGVCNGMFMYFDDNQETDIEWISDPESFANIDANNGTRAMLYTNQNLVEDVNATTVSGRAASDATSAVHEYRLDWTEDATRFYLDGVLQQTITENVPTVSGQWLWNDWVNGDPYFTAGAPVGDAVFKIQKIVMFYNPA